MTWVSFCRRLRRYISACCGCVLLSIASGYGNAQAMQPMNPAGCQDLAAEEVTIAKMRDAIRINPWSFFDKAEDLVGSYVDTVGYVVEFGEHLYLTPSAEYSKYYLPRYVARLAWRSEKLCGRSEALAQGDYIGIIGRVAVCSTCGGGEVTFDDVVLLRKLSYPSSSSLLDSNQ